jgi:ABC-type nitrate/sulfonate/bicarbonate transport system substrate-binding protein
MIELKAGFMPLLDAAILIMAVEKGFAEEQGIGIKLVRESSWANIRDRISVGQFDVAHMLAPLPIAQNLGLSPLNVPLIAPFALGLGGNAVTVSRAVYELMIAETAITGDPHRAGAALRHVVIARRKQGLPNLVFAVVHGYSVHAYELRYWLAASGIQADVDVALTIVPPTMMNDALASGAIDGFCVGEPWNSNAVDLNLGEIVTTKASIWRSSPEKVLGLRQSWASENPDPLNRLLLALHHSAMWCAAPSNIDEMTKILAHPKYVGVGRRILRKGLAGEVLREHPQDDFLIFEDRAANFPWVSHALWIYSQMVRWNQVKHSAEGEKLVAKTYRPDIYRLALKRHGVPMPGGSSKVEGALQQTTVVPSLGGPIALGPDGFFDGVVFDPTDLKAYLQKLGSNAASHKI